jgi:Domain of unknown function (DUF929)
MSKQPKRRPQARKGRTVVAASSAGKRSDRTSWIIAGVVIAVGVALIFVFASGQKKSTNGPITGRQKAPASLVKKVTTVPQSVMDQVGAGSTSIPGKLPGPTLTSDGKPRVVYLGAEYCPYCATERWAMVNALSRFGTFKNLQITTSSATDVDANTPTWSFKGSTFTSPYIKFESIESEDNKGNPLETPTSEQQDLVNKYDKSPYVAGGGSTSQQGGTIPFIDIANQYIVSGAQYDVSKLQGKTFDEIAAAMHDPSSDISQGAVGAANSLTAAICNTTGNKPANVCNTQAVKAVQAKLPTQVGQST